MSISISPLAYSASILHNVPYNGYQDIVWSLNYSLCGSQVSQGGFTTFLIGGDIPSLTGGGIGRSLGYASSSDYTGFANMSGISGAVMGIGFDTTGSFGMSGNSLATGLASPILNSLTIRVGSEFAYLTCIALSALDSSFTILSNVDVWNVLRFRLGYNSTVLYIDRYVDNVYRNILTIPTTLSVLSSTMYKVGASYAGPISGNSTSAVFSLKGFHVEGSTDLPVITSIESVKYYALPVVQTLDVVTPISLHPVPRIPTLIGEYEVIEPPAPDPCPFFDTLVPCITAITPPSPPDNTCGNVISFPESFEGELYTYVIGVGTGTGLRGVTVVAVNLPIRFSITWNGNTYTSGFLGNPELDSELITQGYTATDGYTASLIFNKDVEESSSMIFTVENPLKLEHPAVSDGWAYSMVCEIPACGTVSQVTYLNDFHGEALISVGATSGLRGITPGLVYTYPTRFTIIWNGNTYTTGFMGDPGFNDSLIALGYPPTVGTTASAISFTKGVNDSSFMRLIIETPFGDIAHATYTPICPYGS
jgi:hypothetical protein